MKSELIRALAKEGDPYRNEANAFDHRDLRHAFTVLGLLGECKCNSRESTLLQRKTRVLQQLHAYASSSFVGTQDLWRTVRIPCALNGAKQREVGESVKEEEVVQFQTRLGCRASPKNRFVYVVAWAQ